MYSFNSEKTISFHIKLIGKKQVVKRAKFVSIKIIEYFMSERRKKMDTHDFVLYKLGTRLYKR